MIFKDVQQMRPARLKRFMARLNFDVELELHRVDCAGRMQAASAAAETRAASFEIELSQIADPD